MHMYDIYNLYSIYLSQRTEVTKRVLSGSKAYAKEEKFVVSSRCHTYIPIYAILFPPTTQHS